MKTRGFWLGRQQMRWLIVLLALMPLVPTGILVRDLIKAGQDEREFAIALKTEAERLQLISIANRLSRNPDGPATPEELAAELSRIFGDGARIDAFPPNASPGLPASRDGAVIDTEITDGRLEGWKVFLAREFEAPDFLEEQIRKRWWLAIGIMGGVTLAATAIWWAVNRGLRVDELRSDLLATVAHEMKTPLSSMRVLLETLEDGTVDGTGQQREYLELLQRENARLSRLSEDFLTFGRLERGEFRMKIEEVPLESLVSRTLEELQPAIRKAGATIACDFAPGVTARADRDSLIAILTNLVENALKYGGENPEIAIHCCPVAGKVFLVVADTGPGIPRELRKSIFRRYFRVDRRLDERGSGVGLGLAICRLLVRKMKGRIRAEAGKDDKGLRVVVTLPAASANREEAGEGPDNHQPEIRHAQRVDH